MNATVVRIEARGTTWIMVDGASKPVVMIRRTIRAHADLVVGSVVRVEYDRHMRGLVRSA